MSTPIAPSPDLTTATKVTSPLVTAATSSHIVALKLWDTSNAVVDSAKQWLFGGNGQGTASHGIETQEPLFPLQHSQIGLFRIRNWQWMSKLPVLALIDCIHHICVVYQLEEKSMLLHHLATLPLGATQKEIMPHTPTITAGECALQRQALIYSLSGQRVHALSLNTIKSYDCTNNPIVQLRSSTTAAAVLDSHHLVTLLHITNGALVPLRQVNNVFSVALGSSWVAYSNSALQFQIEDIHTSKLVNQISLQSESASVQMTFDETELNLIVTSSCSRLHWLYSLVTTSSPGSDVTPITPKVVLMQSSNVSQISDLSFHSTLFGWQVAVQSLRSGTLHAWDITMDPQSHSSRGRLHDAGHVYNGERRGVEACRDPTTIVRHLQTGANGYVALFHFKNGIMISTWEEDALLCRFLEMDGKITTFKTGLHTASKLPSSQDAMKNNVIHIVGKTCHEQAICHGPQFQLNEQEPNDPSTHLGIQEAMETQGPHLSWLDATSPPFVDVSGRRID